MMTARQMAGKVHLWLGLASGLVVFVVAVTGCLYVFEKEAQDLFYHELRFVEQQPVSALLPPSAVLTSVRAAIGGDTNPFYYDYTNKPAQTLLAGEHEVRTHQVWSYDEGGWTGAYVHPYTGEVLAHWAHSETWLESIEALHVHLWLPPEIGRPIVGAATLIFVILLVTGLWLWFPIRLKAFSSKRGRRPLFKVTWTLSTKRLNYDLHNVVGFYATWVMLFIALTGLTWSYPWVEDGLYWAASGGQWPPDAEEVQSVPPPNWTAVKTVSIDAIYQRVRREHPDVEKFGVIPPADSAGTLEIVLDRDETNYSGASELHFDPYTGTLMEADLFAEKNAGAKLRQMNYDLHAGVIWGFPTKLIAFFASLVAASLPVTGFLVWWPKWRRKRRHKKRQAVKESRRAAIGDGTSRSRVRPVFRGGDGGGAASQEQAAAEKPARAEEA